MHLLAYAELDGFYQAAFPADGISVVVLHERRVLDRCGIAAAKGVEIGMSLDASRQLLPDARYRTYVEAEHRARATAWWDVLAEHSDRVEPVSPHAAYLDVSGHPDPIAQIERLREDLTCVSGRPVRVALATSRWRAAAAVRYGDDDLFRLPPCAAPVSDQAAARVARMGYRTLGELAEVGWVDLRAWLGEEGSVLFEASRGRGSGDVAALWPPASIARSIHFDGPTDDRIMLDRAIDSLADLLSGDLAKEDRSASKMKVSIERENGRWENLSRTFASRMGDRPAVRAALDALLHREPWEPITALRVRLEEVDEARGRQLKLGERTDGASLGATIQTLAAAFGVGRVIPAALAAMPRRKKVLRAWSDAIGWA